MDSTITSASPRRPRVVSWIAGLYAVQGLLLLPLGLIVLFATLSELGAGLTDQTAIMLVYGSLVACYGLLALPIAYGLFRLRAWAWTLGMALQGLLLGTALVQAYFGEDDWVTLALGVFVVLCLNQQEVRKVFGIGWRRDEPG